MSANLSIQTGAPGTPAAKKRSRPKRFQSVRVMFRNPKAITGFSILAFFLLITIFAPLLATHNPTLSVGMPNQPPNGQFWFGTTDQGWDVYSQWIYGTRTSMLIGLCSGFLSTLVAVLIGVTAGYKGGPVDSVLNMLTNIMLALPGFPLLLVIASYVPKSGPVVITFVLGLTGWYYGARQKRAQAMTFANRDFVLAAKLSGKSDLSIVFTEIMPNMISFIFNSFIFAALGAILGEASLEFLGLGSPMTPSWGNILNWADRGQSLLMGTWWWFVPPGLSIAAVGLAFNLINYAIDEVGNPRLRKPPKAPKRRVKRGEGQQA